MKRAIAWENQQRQKQDRFASTLAISASIIAAVAVIGESVSLARMILERIVR